MQNADLTWSQDLGTVTELLSGEFFRWLGRSTSHQLWSSAMVISPAVRGMFGLEWSASENSLTVTPSLPAQWKEARITQIPLGQSRVGLEMHRNGSTLFVRLTGQGSQNVKLQSRAVGVTTEAGGLRIPLASVEVGLAHGLPEAGSVSAQMKVLDQQESAHSLRLTLSAPANSHQTLFLRLNRPRIHLHAEGAEVSPDSTQLLMSFGAGAGYVEQTVTLTW